MIRACALIAAFLAAPLPGWAESLFDVVRQGYQLVHEESHLSFDGCEHDKPYSLGELIFVCDDYEYDYEYGPALVMGRSFSHQGREVQSWYLCLEDECYSGELYRR